MCVPGELFNRRYLVSLVVGISSSANLTGLSPLRFLFFAKVTICVFKAFIDSVSRLHQLFTVFRAVCVRSETTPANFPFTTIARSSAYIRQWKPLADRSPSNSSTRFAHSRGESMPFCAQPLPALPPGFVCCGDYNLVVTSGLFPLAKCGFDSSSC